MGFFGKNAQYDDGNTFELAEAGVYLCNLAELITEMRPGLKNPEEKEPAFRFVFETVEAADSEGWPFKFIQFTGTKYSNPDANLTKLIDGMLGRSLTPEEFNDLDIKDLQATQYDVMIMDHVTKANKKVNKIAQVRPHRTAPVGQRGPGPRQAAAQRPAPPAPADEDEIPADIVNPFEDDDAVPAAAPPARRATPMADARAARQPAGAVR